MFKGDTAILNEIRKDNYKVFDYLQDGIYVEGMVITCVFNKPELYTQILDTYNKYLHSKVFINVANLVDELICCEIFYNKNN